MKRARSIIFTAVSTVAIASLAFAQPAGLDSLNDDALLNDLAQRGLTSMLERAFEINKTPEKKREAIRASAALSKLARDSGSLSVAQRREVIDRVASGIADILPTLNDPAQLTRQADLLINVGVKLDVNTLEYWGESTTTQAQLRPVVQAVIEMLDRADTLASKEVEDLAAKAAPTDEKAITKIETLENLSQYAKQTRAIAGYYLALCLDASDARRAETAKASLAFLADYDFEGNPALKNLKIVIGKLNLVAGEFEAARQAFDAASNIEMQMPADADVAAFDQQQKNLSFEARYFRSVVEVLAKNPTEARKQFDQLLGWEQSSGLTADESIATANQLLEHRILRASGSDADRQKASALLIALLEKRPELVSQVMTQLRSTITSDTPVKSLEPLLLRSLISDAQDQVIRSQQESNFKPDPKVLTRGIDASRELISREGQPGLTPVLVSNAEFLLGSFLESQGDRLEAAKTFVKVAEDHRDDVELARGALNNAQRLFAQLGGMHSDDPAVTSLYDKIVPLSIGEPFSQKELCYDWAFRLQQVGKAREAIPFYRQVSKTDRRYAASRYYLMVALHQVLDEQHSEKADRQKICEEILQLADEVRSTSNVSLQSADATSRPILRQRLAQTVILASDVARTELKDPQRALTLLVGVEDLLAGLKDETQLLGEAMFTRVQANMQAGQSDEAVKGLVELLNKSGGEQGATIVFNMLSKLEADFSAAELAHDRERMAKLQTDRAALTPYLVKWSENNTRAEISRFAYSYRVYDAETQRQAAEFAPDPGQKATRLQTALKLFDSLDTEAGRQQYKASRTTPDRLGYDPQVLLGKARIRFALGEWVASRDAFARLLSDRALGTPITSVTDAGQVRQVDNDVYWEATARLIRSKINVSDNADSVKTFLREQYVRWEDRVGGTKWKAEFDSLRQELIPEFVPDPLPQ